MLERPYKFLDFYTAADASIFAGRDKEIDILLSDILATRLVVLYAKTGCGKSSLINAGVRPRLDKLEYPSLLIRVQRDPAGSALAALREAGFVAPGVTTPAFLAMIREATAKLEMPLVLFLDQFEEFFVYLPATRQQEFIADLAKLYDDPHSGVHIVLSMREEFFYQLDSFRDHIPRIFHKESNLRLRWLSIDAARQVIQQPAEKFGVTFEATVMDSILMELAEDGWIEPARLQIVCDTLWDRRKGSAINSELYRQLGGARRILDRRIVDDFDQRLSAAELRALQETIPALSSTEGTKKIRAVEELCNPDPDGAMASLVEKLLDLRLLRPSNRDRVPYVEWISDYLAERAGQLAAAVHTLWLRRLVAASEGGQKLAAAELRAVSAGKESIGPVTAAAGRQLLRSALEEDVDVETFYHIAGPAGFEVLRDCALGAAVPIEAAEGAVRLLGRIGTPGALEILASALDREDLAFEVLSILSRMKTPAAKQLLGRGLANARLAGAIDAAPDVPAARASVGEDLPTAGEERVAMVRERLEFGKLMVVLGPGSSLPALPDAQTAAQALLAKMQSAGPSDLPLAAEFYAAIFGRRDLIDRLRQIYTAPAAPTALHRYLATIEGGPMFVSSCYDQLLETAFREAGRELQVAARISPELWSLSDRGETRVMPANELLSAPYGRPSLFKVRGSFEAPADQPDGMVITEEDHWQTVSDTLPTPLRYRLGREGAIVLGCSTVAWHARLLMSLLFRADNPRRRKNFVVAPHVTRLEAQFWGKCYAEILNVPLERILPGSGPE